MKGVFLSILFPIYCNAQNIDINLSGGVNANVFTIGRQEEVKSGLLFSYLISASFVNLKHFDFGIQYQSDKFQSNTSIIGAFSDYKIKYKRSIFNFGICYDKVYFSEQKIPPNHWSNGYVISFDNTNCYGLRIGYKLRLIKWLYFSFLINPIIINQTERNSSPLIINNQIISVPLIIGFSIQI